MKKRKSYYTKQYMLVIQGKSYRVTIPSEVVERKAREMKLSAKDFMEKFGVEILYDELPNVDAQIKFVRKETVKRK